MSNPFLFKGRLRRLHYFFACFALNLVDRLAAGAIGEDSNRVVPLAIVALLLYWPTLALSVQRAHDIGRSGLFVAGMFATLVGGGFLIGLGSSAGFDSLASIVGLLVGAIGVIMSLVLIFSPGEAGENQYGEDPRLETFTPSPYGDV